MKDKNLMLTEKDFSVEIAAMLKEDRRDVKDVLDLYIDLIKEYLLKGYTIKLTGIGRIETRNRRGSVGVNNEGEACLRRPYKKLKLVEYSGFTCALNKFDDELSEEEIEKEDEADEDNN